MKRPRRAPKKPAKSAPRLYIPEERKPPNWDNDPYYIDPKKVPKGKAYQWVLTHAMGVPLPIHMKAAVRAGWRRVKGRKPLHGMVLMEISKAEADKQLADNINRAQQQIREAEELFKPRREGGGFPIASSSWVTSEPYEVIPSDTPPAVIDVTVKFRLTGRFLDAASALKLSPEEYAKRRAELFTDGRIGGLLLPVNGALEIFEAGVFSLTPMEK